MSLLSLISTFNNGVVLSEEGIVSDADLSFGSSTFGTNQTSAIQAILDTASASSPLFLVWDAKVSVTGLRIKSYTYIFCLPGCGAILRDNSDNFLLSNYSWVAGNNSILDYFITIQGGIWNGNGYRSSVAKQVHSNSSKGMITAFNFTGVRNLEIKDLTIFNSRTFAFYCFTSEYPLIDNVLVDQGEDPEINQDGISFGGYTRSPIVTNCRLRCGDDRIVFSANAAGGVAYGEDHTPYTGVEGDIENIYVNHIAFLGEGKGIRLNSTANKIDGGYFGNIKGTCRTMAVIVESNNNFPDYTFDAGNGDFRNLVFENWDVEITTVYDYDYLPDVLGMYQVGGNFKNITFRNITRTNFTYDEPTFVFHNNYGTLTGTGLLIDNYTAIETGTSFSNDHIQFLTGTVNEARITNSYAKMAGNNGSDFIAVKSGATVPVPKILNVKTENITNVLDNESGSITAVMANGIDHGGASAAFNTANTISALVLTHWRGTTKTAGTFTTTSGDAY